MIASDAARIFHDWAEKEGLLAEGAAAPVVSRDEEFSAISPITDAGLQILRTKQVQSVCFSDLAQEILIFLKRTAPKSKLQLGRVPAKVDDVSIRYRQGQPLSVGTAPPQPYGSPPYVIRQTQGRKAYSCGGSISVGNWRDAGTLGSLVRDKDGKLYGLTNNHVSGSCSFADVGLPILAPGVYDVSAGGISPFTIGFHTRSLPFLAGSLSNVDARTNLDAAIFTISKEEDVTSFQGESYDTPQLSGPIIPGMEVEKVGRTTGHRFGVVMGQIYGVTGISYSMPLHNFSGVVPFDPVYAVIGKTDVFSDSGDSGSLVIGRDADGNRRAVGIVVGGRMDGSAPGGKTSLILPIEPILAAFGVSLVQGHNV